MRYWDCSALVPLLWGEAASPAVVTALQNDPAVVTWWGTWTECLSAIARRERDGAMGEPEVTEAIRRLAFASSDWEVIVPSERVRRTTGRLLRTHDLRAADALQLAAASVAAEDHPASLVLVTLDRRLAAAARREGFEVLEPGR
jgi:hypothetical protein